MIPWQLFGHNNRWMRTADCWQTLLGWIIILKNKIPNPTDTQMHFNTIIKGSVSALCLIELPVHVMSHVAVSFWLEFYLSVGVQGAGLGWWTLDDISLWVAEGTGEYGEARRVDHPAVPSQLWQTKKKCCCVSAYVSSRGCAQTPQHTCHEDLRGQRATLQACAVSTLRGRSEVLDHHNWKDKVKGERVLDAWLGLVETTWNLRVGIACRVLGIASNVIEGSHPMLSDEIQPSGRQPWLALQVESTEEALPDGLQRLTLAPEHHTAFQLFKCCLKWPWTPCNGHFCNTFYEEHAVTPVGRPVIGIHRRWYAIRSGSSGGLNMQKPSLPNTMSLDHLFLRSASGTDLCWDTGAFAGARSSSSDGSRTNAITADEPTSIIVATKEKDMAWGLDGQTCGASWFGVRRSRRRRWGLLLWWVRR